MHVVTMYKCGLYVHSYTGFHLFTRHNIGSGNTLCMFHVVTIHMASIAYGCTKLLGATYGYNGLHVTIYTAFGYIGLQ